MQLRIESKRTAHRLKAAEPRKTHEKYEIMASFCKSVEVNWSVFSISRGCGLSGLFLKSSFEIWGIGIGTKRT